ncbi:MAG: hypothetical protein ISS27_00265 [Candidatus Omnitrophica bacterium]|nr:hypothetical protein [Candidatus Omnitrophota bacterium]
MTKSEVKKLDSTKRQIDIEVSGERIKNKFEEAFGEISKSAKIPGFRPGHAPRDILEKNFSGHAQELVLKNLIPEVYDEVVKAEALDVIEMPQVTDVHIKRDELKFTATVEVMPEIQLKKYKGIRVNYKKIEVAADELKRDLDALKESRKLDSIDDRFARSIGYPDLAELKAALERQIFIRKENQQRQRIEKDLIEGLTKDLDLKIPQVMVSRHQDEMLRQAKVNLALKGVERQEIDKQEKQLRQQLEPEAKRQVRDYLVLAHIAKKENIEVNDQMPQKVIEFLLREADWQQG